VTLVADGHVPDDVYVHVRQHLSEQELVNRTTAVLAINGWNRLAISFRWLAWGYQPKRSGLT
jgi:alkylhydroperoxidase family enzyme